MTQQERNEMIDDIIRTLQEIEQMEAEQTDEEVKQLKADVKQLHAEWEEKYMQPMKEVAHEN